MVASTPGHSKKGALSPHFVSGTFSPFCVWHFLPILCVAVPKVVLRSLAVTSINLI